MSPEAKLFVDFHFYPGMHHYWTLFYRNASQLECLNGGEMLPLKLPTTEYVKHPQYIMAYNKNQAKEDYIKTLGIHVELKKISVKSAVPIFKVIKWNDGVLSKELR